MRKQQREREMPTKWGGRAVPSGKEDVAEEEQTLDGARVAGEEERS